LYIINSIPLWGILLIAGRDLFILTGSFILWRHRSKIYGSNFLGKITGLLYGGVICAYTLNLVYIGEILLYICIPAIIGTFAIYLDRYVKTMKGDRVA
jgi:phosphatidylglycerophosphate synthase